MNVDAPLTTAAGCPHHGERCVKCPFLGRKSFNYIYDCTIGTVITLDSHGAKTIVSYTFSPEKRALTHRSPVPSAATPWWAVRQHAFLGRKSFNYISDFTIGTVIYLDSHGANINLSYTCPLEKRAFFQRHHGLERQGDKNDPSPLYFFYVRPTGKCTARVVERPP